MIMCTKHHHDEGRVLYIQRIIPPWGVAPVSGPDKGSLRRWRALVWPVTRLCVEGKGAFARRPRRFALRRVFLCWGGWFSCLSVFPPSARGPDPRSGGGLSGFSAFAVLSFAVRPWAQSPAGWRSAWPSSFCGFVPCRPPVGPIPGRATRSRVLPFLSVCLPVFAGSLRAAFGSLSPPRPAAEEDPKPAGGRNEL